MNLTDPVADFLTRIRNSIRARHQKLDVPASKLKAEIARILKEEGYIANYKPPKRMGRRSSASISSTAPTTRRSFATCSVSPGLAAASTSAATRSAAYRVAWASPS